MTTHTLSQQPLGQPSARQIRRLRDLRSWLRRDHGVWTDLVYGALPVVPMMLLLAIPGRTLLEAMAAYGLLSVLVFVGLMLHGAWRQARAWYRRRMARL